MKLCDSISSALGIDPEYISIISKKNYKYKKYYINKKNGKKRLILQPSKELKVIQKWLLLNIFKFCPVSKNSAAYSIGNSVKKNALKHKNSNYILHMDIKDFFPSIHRNLVLDALQNNPSLKSLSLRQEDLEFILDICLYKGNHLTIGSVSSPALSNIVMIDFDNRLQEKLNAIGSFIYTRYADDIIISSKSFIPKDLINMVEFLLKDYHFELNKEKTYFMSKKGRRTVTGVVIDNNTNCISIGSFKYQDLKRLIYRFLIKGEGNPESIKGSLSYLKSLNQNQYNNLVKIYTKFNKYDRFHQIFPKDSLQ